MPKRILVAVDEADENVANNEASVNGRRRGRRRAAAKNYKEGVDDEGNPLGNDSEEDPSGDVSEEDDEEEVLAEKPRRGRSSKSKKRGQQDNDELDGSTRRKSSRSTRFASSMKEPNGDSIADLLKEAPSHQKKAKGRGGVGSRRQNDRTEDDMETDADGEPAANRRASRRSQDGKESRTRAKQPISPKQPKSPAVRHKSRRHRVKTEIPVSDDSSVSSDEDESDESVDEEDEMKIQRIIASLSEPRRTWHHRCEKMNTSEIENGSRWFQNDEDGDAEGGDDTFEERFLVKWADLSYLHCSWELEGDLISQIEGSKTYLTTFFRKSVNGLLFDSDERGDGEYFDPSFVQIERILEIIDPDPPENEVVNTNKPKQKASESSLEASSESEYGIILDKKHPDYEEGTGRQFLVKWANTPYSDCTYEFERDLILNDVEYEDQVQSFLSRARKPNKTDMKKAYNTQEEQTRRLYKIFGDKVKIGEKEKEQKVKEYQEKLEKHIFVNGGQLRDYQAEGVSWLMSNHINNRSSILADEMGLGKTIQTAVYVNMVATALSARGPFLIVAPLSTIPHWYREFSGWTRLNTIVYHGSAKDREFIREVEFAFEKDRPENVGFNQSFLRRCHPKTAAKWKKTWMAHVIITTPEMLVTDDFAELAAVRWEILVVDEAHRLKNHASKLASNLRDDRFVFNHTLLLTGTPIQNNMNELWTLLNMVAPAQFEDREEFLDLYGDIKSKERIDELHDRIRPYILRRLKEDVEKSVPPKEETLIEVELTVLQKQYYRALYEKNVQFLHRNQKKALDGPSINNLAMQLRKCCNHPFLLRGVENELRAQESGSGFSEGDFLVRASGKLVLLDKLLPRLKQDGHRVLIFSQFKIMLDILEDYLSARTMKYERIDGSITGNKRQMAIDRFQADAVEGKEASFVMLLSTRAGGVGINLTAADTCIIFDSDWNPQNDLQAQARCHRIGQTKSVKVYRLLSRKSYEMQMFHMSSLKMGLDQAVLQGIENGGSASGEGAMTKEEVERLLRHGAYDIFNEEKTGSSEAESNDFVQQDIDSIMARRSKTVVHENTGSKSSAAGGTFSKASFKASNSGPSNKLDGTVEDVDIDDPEFWKKMVGEAQVEKGTDLSGKKRQRKKANYSEKDYERKFNESLRESPRTSETLRVCDADNRESDSSVASDGGASSSSDDDVDFELSGKQELNNAVLKSMKEEKRLRKEMRERTRWGGKAPVEWGKIDAEKVLKSLQTHGYGNLPWDDVISKIEFEKNNYNKEEVKRMCWALVLLTLREAVDDDVHDAARKAERAAKKRLAAEISAASPPSPNEGGVLGASGAGAGNNVDGGGKTDEEVKGGQLAQVELSFEKVWRLNLPWASKAVEDAISFAKSHPPRSKSSVDQLRSGNSKSESTDKKSLPPLIVAFNQNIWPSLARRGWKDEVLVDGKKLNERLVPPRRYVYNGQTYRSVSAVLDVVSKVHPELANTVESVVSTVAAETFQEHTVAKKFAEEAPVCLDPRRVTAQSLTDFLQLYAPLQLMAERARPTKLSLPRKMLGTLSFLHTAHFLVNKADMTSSANKDEDENLRLMKLISVDKRAALPHPAWKPKHDAILIRAIAKHGWIDRESCCRAITEDKSIRWGPPFDDACVGDVDVPESSEKENAKPIGEREMVKLKDTALRAAKFLNEHFDLVKETKGFNQNIVVRSFGLVHEASEESEEGDTPPTRWVVNDSLLARVDPVADKEIESNVKQDEVKQDHGSDEFSELPTRKDLLKRVKTVLSRASGATCVSSTSEAASSTVGAIKHDFCVLDQSDRCNILLAEMLRGAVKTAINKGQGLRTCRKLLLLASREAQALSVFSSVVDVDGEKKQVVEVDGEQKELSSQAEMRKILDHIGLSSRHLRATSARQAKNVLKVVLGIDPIPPKNSFDGIFPVERTQQLTIVKPSRNKPENSHVLAQHGEEQQEHKKSHQKDSAAGDVAINRALAAGLRGENGEPAKFDRSSDLASLQLTSMETLLLSVICSQGLPIWTDEWQDAVLEDETTNARLPGQAYAITWYAMGGVVETAAQVWYKIALSKLTAKKDSLERKKAQLSKEECEQRRDAINTLSHDVEMKKQAMLEAEAYNENPWKLAKKSVMLLEALKQRMGSVDVTRGGTLKKVRTLNRTENGLGPRVLQWCGKELVRWAQSLEIIDSTSRPLAHTAADFIREMPHLSEKMTFRVAALLDRKACRTIFTQVAQQTRLRAIFTCHDRDAMSKFIAKAARNSRNTGDVWDTCPSWWGSNTIEPSYEDDEDLLVGILDYGYSGFDQILKNNEGFLSRMTRGEGSTEFTRSSVQQRVNHLTRELSALEDTAEVMRMVSERANRHSHCTESTLSHEQGVVGSKKVSLGAVQTGIDAFFKSSAAVPSRQSNDSSHPIVVDSDSSVEVIDANGVSSGSEHSTNGARETPTENEVDEEMVPVKSVSAGTKRSKDTGKEGAANDEFDEISSSPEKRQKISDG